MIPNQKHITISILDQDGKLLDIFQCENEAKIVDTDWAGAFLKVLDAEKIVLED